MKRAVLIGLGLIALAAAYFYALRPSTPTLAPPEVVTGNRIQEGMPGTAHPARPEKPKLERLDLAKELNAPGKTIQDDLRTLDGVFLAWQSNFLKEGNPVGENTEITAALTGSNSLHLAFLAPDHPAINARGELCDRWGTPFFFHQQSGTKMEIVSAGPDRKRGTADDAVLTP